MALNAARARPGRPLVRALSSLASAPSASASAPAGASYPFFSSSPALYRPASMSMAEVTAMSSLAAPSLSTSPLHPAVLSSTLPPPSTSGAFDPLLLSKPNPNPNPFDPSPSPNGDPTPNGDPNGEPNPEAEVSDAEWEIRVARGMLHLRDTLPRLFEAGADELFPRDVFSSSVVLKLPVPFPIRISGITGYRMAFAAGRSGLHALHTDLGSSLDRMTFSPSQPAPRHSLSDTFKHAPTHRHKQIRVMVSLFGTPRLPPHARAEWTTSNLYTFNPYSGLIAVHEVEAIRPLPGEGVGEWVMSRVLGWTRRSSAPAGMAPSPAGGAAVRVDVEEVERRE